MKVDPNKPMTLLCTYWGGDRGVRGFDVLVDDKLVATEGVLDKPGEFVQRLYAIPAEMTQGKSVVRVKFLAHRGKLTLSVFDCRTLIGK